MRVIQIMILIIAFSFASCAGLHTLLTHPENNQVEEVRGIACLFCATNYGLMLCALLFCLLVGWCFRPISSIRDLESGE